MGTNLSMVMSHVLWLELLWLGLLLPIPPPGPLISLSPVLLIFLPPVFLIFLPNVPLISLSPVPWISLPSSSLISWPLCPLISLPPVPLLLPPGRHGLPVAEHHRFLWLLEQDELSDQSLSLDGRYVYTMLSVLTGRERRESVLCAGGGAWRRRSGPWGSRHSRCQDGQDRWLAFRRLEEFSPSDEESTGRQTGRNALFSCIDQTTS